MKWVNHKIVTTSIVYGVTGNFFYSFYAFLGATLPDRLEGKPPKENTKKYWQWRKNHRGITHWPLPYLIIIAVMLFLHKENILNGILWEISKVLIFFLVGSLLHILEDFLCGKVPLIHKNKKIGLKLFKVGSVIEYFLSFLIVLAVLYYRFYR